jgi:hypothetical protein
VPKKILLGVVVEMPIQNGLDTLAVFSDGGIRYINHRWKMAVVEVGVSKFMPTVSHILAASQAVVERTGPWEGPRRPPPTKGIARVSFLVSDGLYFGEGPIPAMERDPFAGPVIQQTAALIQLLAKGVSKNAG